MTTPDKENDPSEPWRYTTELYVLATQCIKGLDQARDRLIRAGGRPPSLDRVKRLIDDRYVAIAQPAMARTIAFMGRPTTVTNITRSRFHDANDGHRAHEHTTVEWSSPDGPDVRIIAQFDHGRSARRSITSLQGLALKTQLLSITVVGDVRLYVPSTITPGQTKSNKALLMPLVDEVCQRAARAVVPKIRLRPPTATELDGHVPAALSSSLRNVPGISRHDVSLPEMELVGDSAVAEQQAALADILELDRMHTELFGSDMRGRERYVAFGKAAAWVGDDEAASRFIGRYDALDLLEQANKKRHGGDLTRALELIDLCYRTAIDAFPDDDPSWIGICEVMGHCATSNSQYAKASNAFQDAYRRRVSQGEAPRTTSFVAMHTAAAMRRDGRPLQALAFLDTMWSEGRGDISAAALHLEHAHCAVEVGNPSLALPGVTRYREDLPRSWKWKHRPALIDIDETPALRELFDLLSPHSESHDELVQLGRALAGPLDRSNDENPLTITPMTDLIKTIVHAAEAMTRAGNPAGGLSILDDACVVAERRSFASYVPQMYEKRILYALASAPDRVEELLEDYEARIPDFDQDPDRGAVEPANKREPEFLTSIRRAELATEQLHSAANETVEPRSVDDRRHGTRPPARQALRLDAGTTSDPPRNTPPSLITPRVEVTRPDDDVASLDIDHAPEGDGQQSATQDGVQGPDIRHDNGLDLG